MNKLLKRQIRKFLGKSDPVPENLEPLFEAISEAYSGFDSDRNLIERSLDLSSREFININEKLRAEISERRKYGEETKRI